VFLVFTCIIISNAERMGVLKMIENVTCVLSSLLLLLLLLPVHTVYANRVIQCNSEESLECIVWAQCFGLTTRRACENNY